MTSPLHERLQARLALAPLPAAEVMALALYDPESGYYRRKEGPWGFAGKDYYTALDLGPLLGETLALRLAAAWERLGRPATFTALEPGAGRGWLGRDLLAAATGDFARALRYLHRDDNPAARHAAETALEPFLSDGRARFVSESEPLDPFVGCVFSNELFDALPAQPWRWDGTRWVREMLTAEGPEWHAADHAESRAWFEAHVDEDRGGGFPQGAGPRLRGPVEPGDGSVWCEALPEVVHDLAGALAKGLFLAIDYGDHASHLLAKGADLRRYKGHTVDGKWWEDLGEADLTADVDFTRLQTLLQQEGFAELNHVELSKWIRDHAPLGPWEAEWQDLDPKARLRRMENLLQLTMPGMMGARFRVLEGWKA